MTATIFCRIVPNYAAARADDLPCGSSPPAASGKRRDAWRCETKSGAVVKEVDYESNISIDYVMGLWYKDSHPRSRGASSRDDPEGGAGSGVLRPRLVTAGSGGPGHRPPGITP